MTVDGPPRGSRLDGEIRLVIVESPDLAAPLVGALDAADVGAWVWVEAEHSLYFSPRVLDLLKIETEGDTPLLSRFLHAIHPDDQPRVRQLLEGHFPAGAFVLRYRFANAEDAVYRWIETRGRVERDSPGALVRQGGAMRDITRDVEQEQERQETTARLEALINAIPFAVWGRSGPDLRVSHQNPICKSWWGDLIGRSVADMPREVARIWQTQIGEALKGTLVKMRTRYPHEDAVQVLDEYIAPVHVGGDVTGVVGVCIDVTADQRRGEFEALLTDIAADFVSRSSDTLDAALKDALRRIARFLGGSRAALCEISRDSHLRVTHWWIDAATGPNLPYALEMDVSHSATLIERLRDNQPLVVNRLTDLPDGVVDREWLASRQVHSFVIVPAQQEDGMFVILGLGAGRNQVIEWPRETIPTLRVAAALLGGVLTRQRAEANRRQVEQRMQDAQKLESLGVLAGGIAHDFNNLLTAILGNASLLRSDLPAGADVQGPLEQIEIASRRAADLCRQMLAYAGRGRFALQRSNINDIVLQSQSLLRVSLSKKTSLEVDLAPNLPPVLVDHQQLRQVLMNLVINAAEAIGDHVGTITIRTSETNATAQELARAVFSPELEEGRYVSLAVRDNGAGMSPDTLDRIFDPFFTTKFTGRGLGLPAVLGIVRVHKGALRVESEPGVGSTFELLLRAQPGESEETIEMAPTLTDAAKLAAWRTTGTVLVVDDEPGVRDLLRSVLQRAGLKVVVAEDGRSAVEAFREIAGEVRLALVDLMMPGLDGREALEEMRKIRPDLPAILMSGYTPADVPAAGPQWFLQKPFTPLTVRQAVYRALSGT